MAQLFDVDVRTVNEHIINIFKNGELQDDAVIRKFRITAADGKNYTTNFYNLDAPITKAFFSKVQNKLHFAIHGHTAAELILHRADSTKTNMGLTNLLDLKPEGCSRHQGPVVCRGGNSPLYSQIKVDVLGR